MTTQTGLRSRLFIAVWLLSAMVIAALMPEAMASGGVPATRHEQQAYDAPAPLAFVSAGGVGVGGHLCGDLESGTAQEGHGCLVFRPRRNERYVSLEVTDSTGLPAPGYVAQFAGPLRDGLFFCGELPPTEVVPGLELQVVIHAARVEPACPGTATSGTVQATYSKRP